MGVPYNMQESALVHIRGVH